MKYTDSGTWQTEENFYLMFAPPEKTHQGEIKQLLHCAFLRYRAHREGRTTWYFDVHEFLRVQEVTEAEKREALRLFDTVLNYYPAGVQSTHKEELRKLFETYETGEDRHKGESLMDILRQMYPCFDTTPEGLSIHQEKLDLLLRQLTEVVVEYEKIGLDYTGKMERFWKLSKQLRQAGGIKPDKFAEVFSNFMADMTIKGQYKNPKYFLHG